MSAFLKAKRLIWIAVIAFLFFYVYQDSRRMVEMEGYEVSDGVITIRLSEDGGCQLGDRRIDSEEGLCRFVYEKSKEDLRIFNRYGYECGIYEDLDLSYIKGIELTDEVIYLPVEGELKLKYQLDYEGEIKEEPVFSIKDEKIATVDADGGLVAISNGKTEVQVTFGSKQDSAEVIVSDLIVKMPAEFDLNKPYVACEAFSKEENDLLDAILENRVRKAGYKSRAGAVAAARFLGLEFPYRINYFTENGRLDSYRKAFADGEGRYYHKGLYLDESRFELLNKDYINHGPCTWGCRLYERTHERYIANGLDCSGLVTWIIYQAGFDPGDIGAGIMANVFDMTDLGEKISLRTAVENKTIKVGDLLSGGEGGPSGGGHIAFLTGIDEDENYYVAEELANRVYYGFVIRKYDKREILNYFCWQIAMDEFYGHNDGDLSDYWLAAE